jgi:hypothetical protein
MGSLMAAETVVRASAGLDRSEEERGFATETEVETGDGFYLGRIGLASVRFDVPYRHRIKVLACF